MRRKRLCRVKTLPAMNGPTVGLMNMKHAQAPNEQPAPSELPLVYACSGCSSAAQLANHLAVRLDREGVAEMSCIAGVGGNVRSLVRKAQAAAAAGRRIVAIDGCALACCACALALRGVTADWHLQLAQHGVRKRYRTDFDPSEAARLLAELRDALPSAAYLTMSGSTRARR